MPEISRFYGIIIRMYAQDHPPPHFHADYGGQVAQINILNGQVLEGSVPNARSGWCRSGRNSIARNCWRTSPGSG